MVMSANLDVMSCRLVEKGKARTRVRDGRREKEREARRKKEGENGREARGGLRKGRKAGKTDERKAGHKRKGRNDGRESVEQYKKRQRGTTWSSDCYLGVLRRCAYKESL